MKWTYSLLLGVAAVAAATWIWHGPLGAGERFAQGIDGRARTMLDHFEMYHVEAHMERNPLRRRVILSGPADDFQRREIQREVMAQPGVAEAVWSPSSQPMESNQ